MSQTAEQIQTYDLALEHVHTDGNRYVLPAATINGHTLPRVIYDAEAETVRSQGGESLSVKITRFGDLPVDVDPNIVIGEGRGGYWGFGKPGSAEGHEKASIQIKRARALIEHAIS